MKELRAEEVLGISLHRYLGYVILLCMSKKAKVKGAEEIVTAVVPIVPQKKEIILEGDPDAQLAYAGKAARALMGLVNKKPNPVTIRGKTYLEFGDWQVLARFYGATVEIEWTKELPNNKGYEARALVKRGGEVISSAEGMCTRDEKRWKDADEYAVRSMAQTRTSAKALRNAFGWVAELAGYSATPAEEMPREEPVMAPYTVKKAATVDDDAHEAQKDKIRELLTLLGKSSRTKGEAAAAVKVLTGYDLAPENFHFIIIELRRKVEDTDPIAQVLNNKE